MGVEEEIISQPAARASLDAPTGEQAKGLYGHCKTLQCFGAKKIPNLRVVNDLH